MALTIQDWMAIGGFGIAVLGFVYKIVQKSKEREDAQDRQIERLTLEFEDIKEERVKQSKEIAELKKTLEQVNQTLSSIKDALTALPEIKNDLKVISNIQVELGRHDERIKSLEGI